MSGTAAATPAGRIHIERLGGLGGFGQAGSRVRSVGTVDHASLSAADQSAVNALFDKPPAAHGLTRDGFTYRLTRTTAGGTQTIDVPGQHVPQAMQSAVRDELI